MMNKIANVLFDTLNTVIMLLILVICMYPLYYMLIYTVSSPLEASKGLILLPRQLTPANYLHVFRSGDIVNGFAISAARSLAGTVLTVLGSGGAAYLVTKREMPFRRTIYRLMVITMYLNAGLIPWYMTMVSYGLKNSFLLYIFPGAVNVFFMILIKTYIEESISASVEESAMMDGAGLLTIFFRIILPLSKPILAAVALFSAVGQWNAWTDNLFLVSIPKLKTLQLMLYEYTTSTVPSGASAKEISESMQSGYKPSASSVRMTVTMITVIPIFLVYPFMQKYFAKGLMIGAIKG